MSYLSCFCYFTRHFHVQPEFSSQSSLVWKNPPEIASWKAPLDAGFQVPFSMCQGGFPLVSSVRIDVILRETMPKPGAAFLSLRYQKSTWDSMLAS